MTSEFILTFPLICFILTIFCSGVCVRACASHHLWVGKQVGGEKKLWQCCVMNVIQVKFVYKE